MKQIIVVSLNSLIYLYDVDFLHRFITKVQLRIVVNIVFILAPGDQDMKYLKKYIHLYSSIE